MVFVSKPVNIVVDGHRLVPHILPRGLHVVPIVQKQNVRATGQSRRVDRPYRSARSLFATWIDLHPFNVRTVKTRFGTAML